MKNEKKKWRNTPSNLIITTIMTIVIIIIMKIIINVTTVEHMESETKNMNLRRGSIGMKNSMLHLRKSLLSPSICVCLLVHFLFLKWKILNFFSWICLKLPCL